MAYTFFTIDLESMTTGGAPDNFTTVGSKNSYEISTAYAHGGSKSIEVDSSGTEHGWGYFTSPDARIGNALYKAYFYPDTTSSDRYGVVGRAGYDGTNHVAYAGIVRNGNTMRLIKLTGTSESTRSEVGISSISTDTWYGVKLHADGTTIKVAHWDDDSGSEPSGTWNIDTTDDTQRRGFTGVGIYSYLGSSNLVYFDDISVSTIGDPTGNKYIAVRPSQDSDDARSTAGNDYDDSNYLYLGNIGGATWDNGIRFTNVAIAQGATINSAKLYFYSPDDNSGTTIKVAVYADDADNSATFSSGSHPTDRTFTTAHDDTDLAKSDFDNEGYNFTSAGTSTGLDVTDAVQEVINRGGWTSGNALSLIITDNGSSSNDYAAIYGYNYGNGERAPILEIDFTDPVTYTLEHTTSSVLHESGLIVATKTHTTDALLNLSDTKTHTTDAHLYTKPDSDSWYNDDWTDRFQLIIPEQHIGSDLTDFILYIDEDVLPAKFFDIVKSDGADIRVTKGDGTTELPREVVGINTTSDTLELHVKYTGTLSSSTQSSIWIYVGNSSATEPAAASTYGSESVWDDYLAVWHFSDLSDASGNGRSLTATSAPASTTGLLGGAYDFDGTDDIVSIANADSWLNGLSAITFSSWSKADITNTEEGLWSQNNTGGSDTGTNLRYDQVGASSGLLQVIKGGLVASGDGTEWETLAYTQTTEWQHNLITWSDGTAPNHYVDGSEGYGSAPAQVDGVTGGAAGPFIIGNGPKNNFWAGLVDEFRIRNGSVSEAWAIAERTNQNSTTEFYIYGRHQSIKQHTTDAYLAEGLVTYTTTHDTDALLRDIFTKTHTTDTLLRSASTKTHTTDALLRKASTKTHTTDALLRKENTTTHTTDTLLRGQDAISHTTDTLLRAQVTLTHDTDAYLLGEATVAHTTDTILRDQLLVTHDTNTLLRSENSLEHSTDAYSHISNTKTHTTDALLRSETTKTHTTDAYLTEVERRIWSSGFETNTAEGTSGVQLTEWTLGYSTGQLAVTSVKHGGDYSMKFDGAALNQAIGHQFRASNDTGPFFVRVYVRIDSLPNVDNGIFALDNSSGSSKVYAKLTTAGEIELYDEDANLVGTTDALSLSTWYRLEIKFDARGSGGSHIIEGKLDGETFGTKTDADISTGVCRIILGYGIFVEGVNQGVWYADDVAINADDYPGEGYIVHLNPNAAGDNTDFTTQGSASNYENINDEPPSDSTYNYSNTLGHIDDFNLENTPAALASGDSIVLVSPGVRFDGSSSSAVSGFKLRLKKESAGTVAYSDEIVPTSTTNRTHSPTVPYNYNNTYYSDPDGSSWTKDSLDTAQLGYEITTANTNSARVSALWLLVEYTTLAQTVHHTSDTYLRKQNTRTHTTESLLRQQFTVTHDTDALLREQAVVSHSADTLLRDQFTENHTTDALLRGTNTENHTTDTYLRGQYTKTHTTNALLREQITTTHSTDSFLTGAFQLVHSTDALLRGEVVTSHTTDILAHILGSVSHGTNTLLRKENTIQSSTDALLRSENTSSHTTDSLLRGQYVKTHTTDTLLRGTYVKAHTVDALLRSTGVEQHTTDVLLRKQATKEHTTDIVLRAEAQETHTTDALLRKENTQTHSTDILLRSTETKTHTTDSYLHVQVVKTHTTDSLLRGQYTTEHTGDALLRTEETLTHTTDTQLHTSETVTHSTDSLIRYGTERLSTVAGTITLDVPRTGSGSIVANTTMATFSASASVQLFNVSASVECIVADMSISKIVVATQAGTFSAVANVGAN